ncbi:hypothetical protein K3181_00500 [Qipengyuania sp. YG27]|uniref:Terminase n=1 Tax=Qipengyuania mesophila TaxID=2867246 RepID=A0ABS7JQQ6_9SPHN|nr:hypothetical protein [Qipengyuania mesophila]MBX7499918.1 hypothetical protein [Qipengyuania mesophila]
MTRKADPHETRLPVPRGELPPFDPVPRKCARHDGWTATRQRRFIEALADSGSVESACRTVNMSTVGAYHLRRQPGADSFRAAWEAALDLGVQRIEDAAMDRALNGTEETIHYHGEHVATRRRYNERLVMFILRNRAADRFGEHGAKGPDAVGKMELERLRRKWRKQWEREWGAEQMKRECETMASINAKIDMVRAKEAGLESPRVRAAREALEEAIAADRAERYDPTRDPDHELYRGERALPGREYDFGIVWEGEEVDEAAEGDGDAPSEDQAPAPGVPRLRSLRDGGWD